MNESIHYKLLEIAVLEENLLHPPVTDELSELMKEYKLTGFEAVILSFVLKFSLERSYIELEKFESDRIKKGDKNYINILRSLRDMEKKGIVLLNGEGRRRRDIDAFNPTIQIDESVFSKLVLGEDVYGKIDFNSTYSILEGADELIGRRKNNKISEDRFFSEFEKFFRRMSNDLELTKLVSKYTDIEKIMIMRASVTKLKADHLDDCNEFIAGIYSSLKNITDTMRKIYQNEMRVFKDKVLILSESRGMFGFMRNPDFELSNKHYEKIFESKFKMRKQELVTHFTEQIKHKNVKNELYFDVDLKKKVDTLTDALNKDRFKSVSKELKAKGFAPGIVSLLYGYPGTGKTATVHEIAMLTGRDILQVDISNINDMYVGESEKRLKEVFNEYRKAKKILSRTPMLLFNEADALIGRRINVERSVDQMRNNMQNIILEELEKFDGIFFATTNLTNNMDDAFNRRFLYKIEFTKPTPDIRKKIWESKMKDIPTEWSDKLSYFDLSGGQIDNIVRKYMIDSILNIKSGFHELQKMCREESLFKQESKRAIGFRN
ncbi:MAG: ATP-binding protein [Candidatus Delongbacteria bacterium]|nr:ATP-binding protein [Candidatus Delongbacteria bacterium]